MPLSVLLTQCLQNDFVAPVPAGAPVPNALHVGPAESARLLGADPGTGPVAQLMRWARLQADDALAVVHIRDWHTADDPAQAAHLQQFGAHAVRGTAGAEFVLDLDDDGPERVTVVDATGLNDFAETRLPAVLDALRAQAPDGELRVGVVGVWTEAKITFLLYDLLTRAGVRQVATCSALTASSSRLRHFAALEQLERILGVAVFDTVGDFSAWLVPDGPAAPAPPARGLGPQIAVDGDPLEPGDLPVVGALFRDAQTVHLTALAGGFSGARVFRADARDAAGYAHAPVVLKLGPRTLVGEERVAFERVEPLLGNRAPTIRGFIDLGERAGLKYAFASMGSGAVTPFKTLYEGGADDDTIAAVIDAVFGEVLAPFLTGARYDRLDLLTDYAFDPRWAPGVAARVEAIAGPGAGAAATLDFPDRPRPNVARFYSEVLPTLPRHTGRGHFVSWVHGDLNGANILRDDRGNVWVIDFARARRGHALQDLAKLENDLMFLFTPLADDDALRQALRVTDALAAVADLAAPLPEAPPAGVTAAPLVRLWRTLRVVRRHVAAACHADRDPWQLRVAGLRYAAHTLGFDEADARQKRWALAAACDHAAALARPADPTLRIDRVPLAGPGWLGLTLQPGRRDRGRDLPTDLAALRAEGAQVLIALLTRPELEAVGVPDYLTAAEAAGFQVIHAPMPDQGVPAAAEAQALLTRIEAALCGGAGVVVHCLGGLGRSGLVAACLLRARGVPAADALAQVRAARDPRAIESPAQVAFVQAWPPAAP